MQSILEILGSVGFNWHIALANFVNFLIILFILNRFVFKKIGTTIAHREHVIQEGLDNGEKAKRALLHAHEEKDKILAHAQKEGHEIVHASHTKAELLAVSIKEQAENDAHRIIEEADEKKKNAEKEAQKEFAQIAPKLVAELTQKALRETMTESKNNDMISRMSH